MKANVFNVFLLFCAVSMIGCNKIEDDFSDLREKSDNVCFVFTSLHASSVLNSEVDESTIKNINLWLYNSSSGFSRHHYVEGTELILDLPYGSYDYYVIANIGQDLDDLDISKLDTLSLSIDPYYDFQEGNRLIMSAHGSFSMDRSKSIEVNLIRCVTKVQLNLKVATAFMSDITLQQVQVLSVPNKLLCFSDNSIENTSLLTDYPIEEIAGEYHGNFYLPENLAGTNNSITKPQERSRANAPQNATCIRVQGVMSGKKVDYFIYLGANMTTDFNLRRNHYYQIDAVITGANTLDLRVSTTEMNLTTWEKYYYPGDLVHSLLSVSCVNNADNYFDLSYKLLSGNGELQINGMPLAENAPLRIFENNNQDIEITYPQEVEGDVIVRLTLQDRYGFIIEQDLTTTFVKRGPKLTFEQEGDSLYAYEFGFLDLHILQPLYAGGYQLSIEGNASLYYKSEIPITTLTVPGNGDYAFGIKPTRLGPNPFRIIVTGEQQQRAEIRSVVIGRTANVQISSMYRGGGLEKLIVYAQSSCPVGEDIEVTISMYLSKLTIGGQETSPILERKTLVIRQGQIEASMTLLPGAGYAGYVVKGDVDVEKISVTTSKDRLYVYQIDNRR